MTTYLCNVFTTAMLDPHGAWTYHFEPNTLEDARAHLEKGFVQAVGHPATCEVLSARLGLDVRPVRANVKLEWGDDLIVAQIVIPRLPEGEVLTKEQVDACSIQFWHVLDEEGIKGEN
jgi:hypothetical protein